MISAVILLFLAALLGPRALTAAEHSVVVIHRPTIVAFFAPVTQGELNNQADNNEALADFQFYATKVRQPLHDAGIDFLEIYASSFRIQRASRTTTFRPRKVKVGYYFVAPDKEPHVEFGVMTDTDIYEFAKNYFGVTAASTAKPSAYCLQSEQVWPNLALKQETKIRGRITDQSGEPLRHSPIELRSFVSQAEQITLKKLATDNDGNFNLGVLKPGDYRLLLSPNRGFKQPAKLECRKKNCTLDVVLMVNPTDMPGAGCRIR